MQDHLTSGGILSVGANAIIPAPDSGRDRVIGIAVFPDGSKLILLDETL